MKKKFLLSSLLVACLAFPTITVFSGCQQNGLYINENTSLNTLKNALKKQNFSVMVENYDTSSQTYNRVINYVTPEAIRSVTETTSNDEKTIYESFEFVMGDKSFYVSSFYASDSKDKYNINNLYTEKKLLDYKKDYENWGNFDYLTSTNNKLALKSYTDSPNITLNFISGAIVTQETKNNETEKITLFNVGNTKVDIPKQITLAGLNADWANHIQYNNVTYEKVGDTYTAIINSDSVPQNYEFNVEATINNLKVAKVVVEDKDTYFGATINVKFNSYTNQSYGIGTYSKEFEDLGNVEYDFTNFLAKGGIVNFQNENMQKACLTKTTDINLLNTCISNRNFTLEQTVTEVDEFAGTEVVKNYVVKCDGVLLSEIETITTQSGVVVNESYVLQVANKLYNINYQNGMMKSYQRFIGLATSSHLNDFVDLLAESGNVDLSPETKQNNSYASIRFDDGNIQTVIFNEQNNINQATESELKNMGCTKVVIPQYAINKIIEQERIILN